MVHTGTGIPFSDCLNVEVPVELEKYATLDLTDEEYEWCLSKSVCEALKLSM